MNERLRNGCGPRAAAAILRHWHIEATPLTVYSANPPDTPFALLGTTPRGLARTLEAYGMHATRHEGDDDAEARAWLQGALRHGPVALCVDLRPLGCRLPLLHWVVARHADGDAVRCTHLTRTRWKQAQADVPWDALMAAWRCRWVPLAQYRHAGVLAIPRA